MTSNFFIADLSTSRCFVSSSCHRPTLSYCRLSERFSEMPKYCSVYKCSATSANEPNRTFHQYPSDPQRKRAWIARIRRVDFEPSTSACVCSYHFRDESDDENDEEKKPFLKMKLIDHSRS